jgi:hypothetical protein
LSHEIACGYTPFSVTPILLCHLSLYSNNPHHMA